MTPNTDADCPDEQPDLGSMHNRLQGQRERIMMASHFAGNLADMLYGEQPTPGADGRVDNGTGGTVGVLMDELDLIDDALLGLEHHLNRLRGLA